MKNENIHAVTGAFGYSGKYIAQRLLAEGKSVITLTNSLQRRNPFGDRLRIQPFNFDAPEKLAESLRGVSVLYNTYWVRFNHRGFTHADAVLHGLCATCPYLGCSETDNTGYSPSTLMILRNLPLSRASGLRAYPKTLMSSFFF